MKLFALLPEERQGLKTFVGWHVGYVAYVTLFFWILFRYRLFKSHWLLEEFWLINMVGPVHTLVFTLVSPFRRHYALAIGNMYRALDGELVFCLMALIVFGVGFYLYSLIIWLLGGLIPAIIYS